jgi:hypothetical protein
MQQAGSAHHRQHWLLARDTCQPDCKRARQVTLCLLLLMPACVAPCSCRWRVHLDVEQSVDLLLANSPELTAAFDPYSKLTAAGAAGGASSSQDRAVSVNTQVRSKGSDGRLWVQFETAAAAEQTLEASRVVQQLGD